MCCGCVVLVVQSLASIEGTAGTKVNQGMYDLTSASAPSVAIHLVDSSLERLVKSWRFSAQSIITLGRADDRDVEISDPYVSRNHAEFHFREGRWVLRSTGRNGVLVNNQAVEQHVLNGDLTFRLGPNGPALRFETTTAEHENKRTLSFDTLPASFFGVDRGKVEREVEEIADGDYFRALQEKAASLRRQRER